MRMAQRLAAQRRNEDGSAPAGRPTSWQGVQKLTAGEVAALAADLKVPTSGGLRAVKSAVWAKLKAAA